MASEPQLKRFEVVEEVASGEAEVLLRARDSVLGREVLLKLPGPGLAVALRNRTAREQTLREAQALARVVHPGIVRLYDAVETEQGPLLVLEPYAGEPLEERLLRENRLPWPEVLELGLAVSDALGAVHAAGHVHRGLGAASIVLTETGPLLTGFGFSKLSSDTSSLGATSLMFDRGAASRESERSVGPEHPAPEQLRGETADARADVFALGWVLFDAIAGVPPFESGSDGWNRPRELRTLVPGVPRELSRVLTRCLATSPIGRYENAGAVRDALAAVPLPKARTDAKTPRQLVTWIGAGLLAVAAGVFGLDLLRDPGEAVASRRERAPVAPTVSYSAGYATRRALLIGIGEEYRGSGYLALPNAKNDIAAIAERLEELPGDWQVKTLLGHAATRAGIIDALTQLGREAEPDDCVFVYYAGHGVRLERGSSAWIVPADAENDDSPADLVPFDDFLRFFDHTLAKHALVAMDCCHSGTIAASRGVSGLAYDERFTRSRAHVVLTSGRSFELSSDGIPGGLSPFAEAFLAALESDASMLTDRELHVAIEKRLYEQGVEQMPQIANVGANAADGRFVFQLAE